MKDSIMTLKLKSHFTGWKESDWDKFLSFATEKNLAKNECIFHAGSPASQVFFLISGTVDIIGNDGDTIAEFIKDEIFGQFEFLTASSYNASASAATACKILSFPKDGTTLVDFEASYPEVYAKLIRSFLIFISQQTRAATRLLKENSPLTKQLRKELYSDKLTGVYNKTYLQENLSELFTGKTSLIMIKPDNFKAINDNFGHDAGDAVLLTIGQVLNTELSKQSKVIRYEGNAFFVVTEHQTKDKTGRLAKKIKQILEAIDLKAAITVMHENKIQLTFSLVVAIFPDDNGEVLELIKPFNRTILEARNAGGSKIVFLSDFLS